MQTDLAALAIKRHEIGVNSELFISTLIACQEQTLLTPLLVGWVIALQITRLLYHAAGARAGEGAGAGAWVVVWTTRYHDTAGRAP